jgi:predicted nucleotidyltransferase component of viral defense system
MQTGFSDIPPTPIKLMSATERFSEKVAALLDRGKPRDWYDVFFYKGILQFDKKIFEKKTGKNAIQVPSKAEFEKDLAPLLARKIDYQLMVDSVKEWLRKEKLIL